MNYDDQDSTECTVVGCNWCLTPAVPDPDDQGVLDDLANDYQGIDQTAQGRGDQQ